MLSDSEKEDKDVFTKQRGLTAILTSSKSILEDFGGKTSIDTKRGPI